MAVTITTNLYCLTLSLIYNHSFKARQSNMKVSERRKAVAYEAISDPIMDLRISTKMGNRKVDPLELDGELFKLEIEIWKRLKSALSIKGL